MSKKKQKPWDRSMPEDAFNWMRDILAAPSPIGLEGAMTYGVLKPWFESMMPKRWKIHSFRGNAGLVVDTHPGRDDLCSVMVVGHADKIRMQVRSIGDDGKIWINSDSFLPTTVIGHEVILFSEDPEKPGTYRKVEGGTVEALGAIHFASADVRNGKSGVSSDMLYLELQMYGDSPKKQVEKLGIKPGDPVILNRPIRRGFSRDTFYGAYLDNGLGCYVTAELARLVAEDPLNNVRLLFAFATGEEIGRFGSRVMAGALKPDVLIGVDVDFDFKAAPGVGDKRYTPNAMGSGFTVSTGSIISEYLNSLIIKAARDRKIPFQRSPVGRDTGTDAMAGVLAAIDAASTSVGIPVRNMHTISEIAHTGDVLACIYGLEGLCRDMEKANGGKGIRAADFEKNHPQLQQVKALRS